MPYYWRKRFTYRRRRNFWPRRTRGTFRRRTRKYRRRFYKYRPRRSFRVRRKIFKKLKRLRLYEYQPQSIRKCNVLGTVCLFQGSPLRSCFNYTQYMHSFVPEYEPGGGGYCIMIETLSSLWEDFNKLKNKWTASNAGLPLVRFLGGTLTFFQSLYTDYCVEVDTCLPLKDYKYTHADMSPSRILQKKHIIKVPSQETRKKRKPYKRVKIRPPSQFQNKWYFQKDVCDIPFVMIKATAVSFTQPFGDSKWQSNNVTLTCLNPTLFIRHDFQNPSATTGYFPKPALYLYSSKKNTETFTLKSTDTIRYLGNSKEYTSGKDLTGTNLKSSTMKDWGNVFHETYIHLEDIIYTAQVPPSQVKLETETDKTTFTRLAEPLFLKYRYNPDKDTGQNNQIYLKENFADYGWDPPPNENIIFSGFPLYDLLFGYIDWEEKVHEIQKIPLNYILVIKSDFMNEKAPFYIPFDYNFLNGAGPYRPLDNEEVPKRSDFDNQNWFPKSKYQFETINKICATAPGSYRPHYHNYIQAQMHYNFRFKWGGCPKTLEKPYDPCSQPTWNIPRNISSAIQIEDPGTQPETIIQNFDWKRDYIKTETIERIQKHTDFNEPLQLSTDSKHNASAAFIPQETSDSETTEEEEETSLQQKLLQLRQQQLQLKQRILHRLKHQSLE
nr:MAG: ORF1 [TTV-like mini virus]